MDAPNIDAALDAARLLLAECPPRVTPDIDTGSYSAALFVFLSLLIGALILATQNSFLPWLAYNVKVFVVGLCVGMVHFTAKKQNSHGLGDVSLSIDAWLSIDPHLFAAIAIPALVFGDAMKIEVHTLSKTISQVALLSLFGVVATTLTFGGLAILLLGWRWELAFAFAAALSATDPVAVVAMTESLRLPSKTTTLLNGESHVGDLFSFLLFSVFLSLYKSETRSSTEMFGFILKMALGGAAIGFSMGVLTVFFLRLNTNRMSRRAVMTQLTSTIALAFLSFVVAESAAGANGVVSTFFAALVIAAKGWSLFADDRVVKHVWKAVEFFSSTLVFAFAGVLIGNKILLPLPSRADYFYVFVFYVVLYAVRGVVLLALYPAMTRLGYGMTKQEGVAVWWGGLRGALALALGIVLEQNIIEVDHDEDVGTEEVFFVGALVMMCLMFNQASMNRLTLRLGLQKPPSVLRHLLKFVARRFRGVAQDRYVELSRESSLQHDPEVVEAFVSSLGERSTTASFRFFNKTLDIDEADPDVVDVLGPEDTNNTEELMRRRFADPQAKTRSLDLLKQIRIIYLDALKASYWDLIQEGVIPKGSHVANSVMHSVEAAQDEADRALADFEKMHLPRSFNDVVAPFWVRVLERMRVPPWVVDYVGVRMSAEIVGDGVYAASCFIDAHESASRVLHEYVGGEKGLKHTPEFAVVLSEAALEVKSAFAYLDAVHQKHPSLVSLVQNRKVVSVVLERQRKYADRLLGTGLLDKKTHRALLLHLRHDWDRLASIKADPEHAAEFRELRAEVAAGHALDFVMSGEDDEPSHSHPRA